MLIIRKHALARAGLIGNPSDGYRGKTISVVVPQFRAEVVLYEWDLLEVVLSQDDRSSFRGVADLVRDVQMHGYYGGVRLVKATIKKFADYCQRQQIEMHTRNFSIRYSTNIPRQVGMGGSSAIIIATLRCLMEFYDVEIPLDVQPSLALSVEAEELGIAAGLQDRVIQVFEGAVFMDFGEDAAQTKQGYSCGYYEPLDAALFPPLYISYNTDTSEPTEVFHNNLKARFENGDIQVVSAMGKFAALAQQARDAVVAGRSEEIRSLLDENFDLRTSLCQLPPWQEDMVRAARTTGASAKFAGSGGAIVGSFVDETQFQALTEVMKQRRCDTVRLGT